MKRNKYSLSNQRLLSCRGGELVPIGLTEVLPGDTIQQTTSTLIRLSALLAPVMHPLHARIHHWFVPHRLVWEDWEKFITGGPDGMDDSEFPTINCVDTFPEPANKHSAVSGSLIDYLGIPSAKSGFDRGDFFVSALPLRGYNLIFNEWYRDQDLVTAVPLSTASGLDTTTTSALKRCAWEKDYFTTSRPWAAKGPDISLPLGGPAPVVSDGTNIRYRADGTNRDANVTATGGFNTQIIAGSAVPGTIAYQFGDNTGLETDLDNVGPSLNEVRTAFALQRYQEARARYGSRYTEYLAYLGVKSSDARLQRPEYLGGGKQTIQFSEVLQTAPNSDTGTSEDSGVGELKGHGIAAMRSNRYRKFFEEHGYIFTMISIKPRTVYMDGIPRTWNRRTKEDFFQKELQHIGQQEVLNKEVFSYDDPDDIFGYQDRYAEYRQGFSQVNGEFRDTLNYWHMARDFASKPSLNSSFINSVPTNRVFANQLIGDHYYIMANHSIQARRLVSKNTSSFLF